MSNGYVYILTNQALPDLIKIGKTGRDSRERARELSSTSVPFPFKVAFEVFSDEYDNLEKEIHNELADYRVASNREFFRYPLDKAIKLLQKLNSTTGEKESVFEAIDITDMLNKKYPGHLRENIVSVRIVQPEDRVWLEITTERVSEDGYMVDQTIRREDLAFIVDGDEDDDLFFRRIDAVQVNAQKFIDEYDPFSICMTTDLFNEESCKDIDLKHNPIYRSKG